MSERKLHVINTSPPVQAKASIPSRLTRRKEMQAKFERMWLVDPTQFNPLRNCMQKERLDRTWELMNLHTEITEKEATDIGCASGVFSRRLRDGGAHVDAADIAENALKELRKHNMTNIEAFHTAMPDTNLKDHAYDVVVCTEVIADLPKDDYRLFFSELARLAKTDGIVVFSTDIDIYTSGALQQLIDLTLTELDIIDSKPSYHALYIRLKKFLETPEKYLIGWKEPPTREKEIAPRSGLSCLWYQLNTAIPLIWFWKILNPLSQLILRHFNDNRKFLLFMENICEFLQHENGISHVIFIGKRRPLQQIDTNEIPVERLEKREVWE